MLEKKYPDFFLTCSVDAAPTKNAGCATSMRGGSIATAAGSLSLTRKGSNLIPEFGSPSLPAR